MTNALLTVESSGTSRRNNGAGGFAIWVLKCVALWLALIVSAALASRLLGFTALPPIGDQRPVSIQTAALIVSGMTAMVLGVLAAQARVAGARLALLIFVALFAIQTAMMQIETLYFNDSLHLPLIEIARVTAQAAIVAATEALVAAVLFRPEDQPVGAMPRGLAFRIAALAVIYAVLYFGAGGLIAWQSAAVRAYYSNGMHIAFLPLLLLQLVRGTLWALIALFLVTRMKGSLAKRALAMAVLFAVLTAIQLLYPNPYMPWAIRRVHLLEVGSSEFLYGAIATFVLLATRRKPVAGQA